MYTFIYSNLAYTRTGMKIEDVTIHHQRTSKNPRISPIFIPIPNHILPGRRRGRRRPLSVGWNLDLAVNQHVVASRA